MTHIGHVRHTLATLTRFGDNCPPHDDDVDDDEIASTAASKEEEATVPRSACAVEDDAAAEVGMPLNIWNEPCPPEMQLGLSELD